MAAYQSQELGNRWLEARSDGDAFYYHGVWFSNFLWEVQGFSDINMVHHGWVQSCYVP